MLYIICHAPAYPMFVDVQRPQVRIVQQPLRLQVDRRLAAALVAQRPLRIDEAPERRAGDAVVRPPFLPANRVYYYKKKTKVKSI